jgi:endonuclease/exonuclease/phosphatase family metal-dependent hydrolase
MRNLPGRIARWRYRMLLLAVFPSVAHAVDVRIVTYNTQDDVSPPTPAGAIPYLATTLEGIGQQKYAGDGILQLPDIIALQETTSNSTTVAPLVSDLNTYYGKSSLYAYSSYQATTSDGTTDGGGPNGLIYNSTTINLIASVGVGTPNSSTNGEFRQVVRYEFQPLVDKGTSNGIFYVYDTHSKSGAASTTDDGTTDGAMRNLEAQLIRNDEAANLPTNAAVLYVGDFNEDGSTEAAYQTMTTAKSPSGVTQGAGIDPANPTNNYSLTWGSSTPSLLTEHDTDLTYRDDLQLMTANVYNDSSGTLDYIAGSLHTFGNNGTTSYGGNVNTSSNTALNDIVGNGSLTPRGVLSAMNTSLGSDHLPVVADYTIATQPNGIWFGGVGTWTNTADWSNGVVPNSSTTEVLIDDGNPASSLVTLNQTASASDVQLDANDTFNISSGNALTLYGPASTVFNGVLNNAGTINAVNISTGSTGAFNLAGGGTLRVTGLFTNQGTSVFSGSQNWSAGSIFNSSGGTATFNTDAGASAATLTVNAIAGTVNFASTQHLLALNISSGALVKLTTNGSTAVLVTSQMSDAGTLDLTRNALDVSGSSLSAITALAGQGYNAGNWNGSGITSSTAAADTTHLTALGVIQNNQSGTAIFTASNQFEGITPGAGDVRAKYIYYGDANLSGSVDGSDYSRIDNGALNHLTGWYNGDFNYDGVINGSDYTLIDNSFNTQGAQLDAEATASLAAVTAQVSGASALAVPEPAGIAVLFAGCLGLLSRRYRTVVQSGLSRIR